MSVLRNPLHRELITQGRINNIRLSLYLKESESQGPHYPKSITSSWQISLRVSSSKMENVLLLYPCVGTVPREKKLGSQSCRREPE